MNRSQINEMLSGNKQVADAITGQAQSLDEIQALLKEQNKTLDYANKLTEQQTAHIQQMASSFDAIKKQGARDAQKKEDQERRDDDTGDADSEKEDGVKLKRTGAGVGAEIGKSIESSFAKASKKLAATLDNAGKNFGSEISSTLELDKIPFFDQMKDLIAGVGSAGLDYAKSLFEKKKDGVELADQQQQKAIDEVHRKQELAHWFRVEKLLTHLVIQGAAVGDLLTQGVASGAASTVGAKIVSDQQRDVLQRSSSGHLGKIQAELIASREQVKGLSATLTAKNIADDLTKKMEKMVPSSNTPDGGDKKEGASKFGPDIAKIQKAAREQVKAQTTGADTPKVGKPKAPEKSQGPIKTEDAKGNELLSDISTGIMTTALGVVSIPVAIAGIAAYLLLLYDQYKQAIFQFFDNVKGFFDDLMKEFGRLWDNFVNWLPLPDAIKDFLKVTLPDAIKSLGSAVVDAIKDTLQSIWNFIMKPGETIANIFIDGKDSLVQLGKGIESGVESVANGASAAAGWVGDKLAAGYNFWSRNKETVADETKLSTADAIPAEPLSADAVREQHKRDEAIRERDRVEREAERTGTGGNVVAPVTNVTNNTNTHTPRYATTGPDTLPGSLSMSH